MPVESKNISRMNFLRRCGPVTVGDVVYKPGGICGPRVQPDYQLVMLHAGELNLRLDARRIHLDAGEAILLAPGHREHFRFSVEEETRHSWCAIRADAVPRRLRRQFSGQDRAVPFIGRMTVLLEWCRAKSENAETRLLDEFYLSLGLAVMCDFTLAAAQAGPVRAGDEALARLGNFIRGAYPESLSLADLAQKAGVSPQHLLKLCRGAHAGTPTEQLYRKRVEVAAELLLGTGLSVGEISERCGFANPFHFSRKFREAQGRSPLAWRQQGWSTKKAERRRGA